MQLEYKKIEQIADNVQFILDNESKKNLISRNWKSNLITCRML